MSLYQTPARRGTGIAAVLALHGLLVYAVITGTAHRMVDEIMQPVKVALLDEPTPAPPPPPPALPTPPPLVPPRPVFVPPPEVTIRPPAVPAPLQAVQTVPPPVAVAPIAIAAPSPPARSTPAARAPDLSQPARILVANCEKPPYPAAARREEATGTSRIRFRIDKSGRVVQAKVTQHSGSSRAHRLLDDAAVEALSGCHFTPGRDKEGHPTGSYASVDYVWSLVE